MGKVESTGDALLGDLRGLLAARNPVIILVTSEEERVEGVIMPVATKHRYQTIAWDHAAGARWLVCADEKQNGKEIPPGAKATSEPGAILDVFANMKERVVLVLRDFHHFWKAPKVNRMLRNLARTLPVAPHGESRTIVIVTPSEDVPIEFKDHVVVVRWKLPDKFEMSKVFDNFTRNIHSSMAASKGIAPEVREAAIDAALGLSVVQAQGAFSKSLAIRNGTIDPQVISKTKKDVIKTGAGIEWTDSEPFGLTGAGGFGGLKQWLYPRLACFTEKARTFGIPVPKGLLLVGSPGTGKSYFARVLATALQCPLLTLDLGATKGGIVGQSEAQIRAAFAVINAVGKCVVLVDEIEKVFGGSGAALDGGVSSDQSKAFLTWMQDRPGGAFVLATANDVSKIPPEFLRKGRFDEIFFVDLPTHGERIEIATVVLKKIGREDAGIDVGEVATGTKGFSGSEIECAIQAGLISAFVDGERALRTEDVLASASETKPLSLTAPEKSDEVRKWAKTRARPAALPEVTPVVDASHLTRAIETLEGVDLDPGKN